MRQEFTTIGLDGKRGRLLVPVPFDPDVVWGAKKRHHVNGTLNGLPIRAVIEQEGGQFGFVLGPAWLRDCGVAPGDQLTVVLAPEGPQRDDLPVDFAAALGANPQAGEFFDALAQFYRRGYLRWIDGTKNRPDLRQQRIATVIELLAAGVKERPK